MTWSRCGLWRDMKNEKGRHIGKERLLPLKEQGSQIGVWGLKHPNLQEIRGAKDLPL